MKRKTRTSFLWLITFLLSFVLLSKTNLVQAQETKGSITITTSILKDLVSNITGDEYSITAIMPAGTDPHTYTAQASDLETITGSDLIIYHGLNLEAQLADVLSEFGVAATRDLNETDLISVSESEMDPHYWFDIDLYKQTVDTISQILSETYPDDGELFAKNTQAYQAELDELSTLIDEIVATLPVEDRNLVTPHDAFGYFAQKYDFTIYAPQGISTESEASTEQIEETVQYIIDNEVPAVFLDTTSNPQAMEKIQEGVEAQDSSVEIIQGDGQELFADSTAPPGEPGDNYIDMFRMNVELIVENLTK